jgi:enoyl-CoA hydratase
VSAPVEHLVVSDAEGIRTITIDRPEAKNAMTTAMRTGLCRLLADTQQDPTVRAVVLTATDPVFTAGVDFREVADPDAPPWSAYDAQFAVNPGRALRAMRTPVICAVNGACVSGGLELALSSAFVVAV